MHSVFIGWHIFQFLKRKSEVSRGYGATVARLTPDQTVGRSNRSGLIFSSILVTTRICVLAEMSPAEFRDSIVVSISACHADDPGSIPGRGVFVLFSITCFSE